ncbi:MAG: hypothetical protein H6741_31335 [Alphaproteobacteria bacterium]|nr:hypothetical protein [Alphaproteobacteria bacterium]
MIDPDDVGLHFNYDHGLQLGLESCMCNFGMSYEADIGHSGHLTLARRVIPDRPAAQWPLIFWDEEEQDGVSFAISDARWLSSWLARYPDWHDDLAERRDALLAAAEAGGDPCVAPVLDAILAGERRASQLYALIAPEHLLTRTHALAEAQGLSAGRSQPWRKDTEAMAEQAEAWRPLIREDPLYNAPAAYAASLGFTTARAWRWLRRNLKYDVGGSIGVDDFTRAAARHLLEHDADDESPYWPVLAGYQEGKHIGGDPFCDVGEALLEAGETLEAITAFENAILFERGWSEEYHERALEGLGWAAEHLGAPDFKAYVDKVRSY